MSGVTPGRKRLVFFETWVDPVAERIVGARGDVELVNLRRDDPVELNDAAMRGAHGYQPRCASPSWATPR